MNTQRLALLLLILPLLGWGCIRIGPRIVRAPEDIPVKNTATNVESKDGASKTVAYLKLQGGSATVKRGSETAAAKEDTELYSGDRVIAATDGVLIVYPDTGASRLDKGTEVVILADVGGPSTFTEIRLVAGSIWTRFERLFGPSEEFSVAANGVVATVRGTAFGVTLTNGDVDVEVADHQVEVTTEADEKANTSSTARLAQGGALMLTAGQGLRIKPSLYPRIDAQALKLAVRTLTDLDRAKKGFVFGMTKLREEFLRIPINPFRLQIKPVLPTEFLDRYDFLKLSATIKATESGFAAPTRGVLPGEMAPQDATPQTQGPTTTSQSGGLDLLGVPYQR